MVSESAARNDAPDLASSRHTRGSRVSISTSDPPRECVRLEADIDPVSTGRSSAAVHACMRTNARALLSGLGPSGRSYSVVGGSRHG